MSEITVFNARPQGTPQQVVRAVLHADHLSALAAKDAEMARVKIAIVEWATYADTRSTNHGLNMTPHQVLHSILRRAALSTAPEGEKP